MKTIIFDLDGTLLPMETESFTKLYAKALTEAFYDFDDRNKVFKQVMHSVQATVLNKTHETNYNKFFNHFDKHMDKDVDVYIKRFDEFYASGFGQVQSATSVSEEMIEAVDLLKKKQYNLIIATNPIFPMSANKQRIKWAGLDIEKFDHVTSFESNHYCKPHLEFYSEVLEMNQLNAEDVLMVGNDVQEDLAIKALGAKTYIINNHLINRKPDKEINSDYIGSYCDFLEFVKGL